LKKIIFKNYNHEETTNEELQNYLLLIMKFQIKLLKIKENPANSLLLNQVNIKIITTTILISKVTFRNIKIKIH
jgi:hypothetical protein